MGKPRPAEVREKISRSQQERLRKIRESSPVPDRKKCPQCGEWKDAPKDFGWMKRKLVNGEIVHHIRSTCKKCTAERAKKYREKLKREGKYKAKTKQWNANRKKRRYRTPAATKFANEHNDSLPTGPISEWLKRRLQTHGYPPGSNENLNRRIDSIVAQEYPETALATIDALLMAYDKTELLDELYPLPEQG